MSDPTISPVLAERTETGIARSVAGAALAERARAQVEASMAVALRFPRNELQCSQELSRSCQNIRFAEDAEYSFKRAGSTVTGPSVRFAREAKRCWGNMESGFDVIERTADEAVVMGWAVDLQKNTWARISRRFKNRIQRKKNGETIWIEPDERDFSELAAVHGAKAERNAVLQLMPPHMIEENIDTCRETVGKAMAGEKLPESPEQAARRLAAGFTRFSVSVAQLEAKVGKPLVQLSEKEFESLRAIWRDLRDGKTSPADHFAADVEAPRAERETGRKLGELKQKAHDARARAGEPVAEAQVEEVVASDAAAAEADRDAAAEARVTEEPAEQPAAVEYSACETCLGTGIVGSGDDRDRCDDCGGAGKIPAGGEA